MHKLCKSITICSSCCMVTFYMAMNLEKTITGFTHDAPD